MPSSSLLEREGELARVRPEVDPYLEMAEIADRASKAHGPAVLFEQPRRPAGQPVVPVLMNQLGSYRRLELALGAPLDDIAKRIDGLLELQVPSGLVGKVKALGQLKELASYGPRYGRKPLWREVVVDPPDLGRLPVLTTWPDDGGPFITLPLVFTKDPQGRQNVGMYRMQVYDGQDDRHALAHAPRRRAPTSARRATGMEVAVALGGDPAITYAATAPLPPGIERVPVRRLPPRRAGRAGAVQDRRPARCRPTPRSSSRATSSRASTRLEGPFGDHTGFYSLADDYPVFHVTAITHRRDPIYPTTIVGKPPMEDCYLGKATERIFLPLLQAGPARDRRHRPAARGRLPQLRHRQHPQGVPGPRAQGHERDLGHRADDVHQVHHRGGRGRGRARRQRGARGACSTTSTRERDIVIVDGPARRARPREPVTPLGSKMGIDATRKWPGEGHAREWPDEIAMDPEVVRRVDDALEGAGAAVLVTPGGYPAGF